MIELFLGLALLTSVQCLVKPLQGFIGPYHPLNGFTWPGEGIPVNTTVYDAFKFGSSAIYTMPTYGNYLFEANTNYILGMLSPPSEGGIINNSNDTDIWKPIKPPGLIQSAHRWSEIAKACPQIMGITIDDFIANYERKAITFDDLKDIKGALLGKTVDSNGKVDHSSPATTPWLKLFICFYSKQIKGYDHPQLTSLLDGVNLWMFDQDNLYKEFPNFISQIQNGPLKGKEIITGAYIKNSRYGFLSVESFNYLIEKSIDLYDSGQITGMFIFSGIFLGQSHISQDEWEKFKIPLQLDKVYYPFLGSVEGQVLDSKTGKPIKDAIVEFYYNGKVFAGRKGTNDLGVVDFSSWAGKSKSSSFIVVSAEKDGFLKKNATVHLKKQDVVQFTLRL